MYVNIIHSLLFLPLKIWNPPEFWTRTRKYRRYKSLAGGGEKTHKEDAKTQGTHQIIGVPTAAG
jgi:hypothetical protein